MRWRWYEVAMAVTGVVGMVLWFATRPPLSDAQLLGAIDVFKRNVP